MYVVCTSTLTYNVRFADVAAERANTITGSRRADRAMKFVSNMFGSKNNNSKDNNSSGAGGAVEKQDAKIETAPATGE